MIRVVHWLLLPFSLLYALGVWLRNLGYDYGLLSTKKYPIRSILIGNLAVGGTGKTPMAEYLIQWLHKRYRMATLSRGYGRKTKGFRYVGRNDQAADCGDEPLQFKHKFPSITVAVAEDRRLGMEQLVSDHELILLDDAYQHRRVSANCNILLFDYPSLLKPILPLPTGNFRDLLPQARRAQLIVITKTPQIIPESDRKRVISRLNRYSAAPVFFSQIAYGSPIPIAAISAIPVTTNPPLNTTSQQIPTGADSPLSLNKLADIQILLLTGIANPTPLHTYIAQYAADVHALTYPDHHNFTARDYTDIHKKYRVLAAKAKTLLITTEKDAQRLSQPLLGDIPAYYLPITFIFEQEDLFQHTLINTLEQSFVNES